MTEKQSDIVEQGKWGKFIDRASLSLSQKFRQAAQGVREFTHENGMQVVCDTDFSKDKIEFAVLVKTGQQDSPPHLPQLAHVAEHMALHYQDENNNQRIQRYAANGGYLHAYVGSDQTTFHGSLPWTRGQEEASVNLMRDMLTTPVVSADYLSNELRIMQSELMFRERQPFSNAIDNHWKAAGTLPHQTTVREEEQSLENVDEESLQNFFDQFYRPENMVLCVSGPVTQSMLSKILQRHDNEVRPSPEKQTDAENNPANGYFFDHDENMRGVSITLGCDGEYLEDPKTMAVKTVASRYLSGALATELRQERGLTYGVGCSAISDFRSGGLLISGAPVKSEDAPDFVDGCAQVLRNATQEIDETILKIAKRQDEPLYPLSKGEDQNRAAALANRAALGLIDMPDYDLAPYIKDVTAADVQNYIRENFFERPLIYSASGNCSDVPSYEDVHDLMGRDIIGLRVSPGIEQANYESQETIGLPAAHT